MTWDTSVVTSWQLPLPHTKSSPAHSSLESQSPKPPQIDLERRISKVGSGYIFRSILNNFFCRHSTTRLQNDSYTCNISIKSSNLLLKIENQRFRLIYYKHIKDFVVKLWECTNLFFVKLLKNFRTSMLLNFGSLNGWLHKKKQNLTFCTFFSIHFIVFSHGWNPLFSA